MAEKEGINLEFVKLLDPEKADDFDLFCRRFEKMERYRRMKVTSAAGIIAKPHYFGAMMVQYGQADGVVGGNRAVPATVLRALFHVIKPLPHTDTASSCAVLVDPGKPHFGSEGFLFLADCAVIPEPTIDQLAMIAVESGKFARAVLGRTPKVAMLSFSTKGSATTPASERIVAATAQARERAAREELVVEIDGELQVDAALVPEIAALKAPGGRIQGDADVLVFPDLNSGNISQKLLQHGEGVQAYGNLILGLARPAAQISRGASEETILGTAAAVGIQAIEYHDLYPEG
jgi:phosphate acetyltransferase